jgi:hypothetical protein
VSRHRTSGHADQHGLKPTETAIKKHKDYSQHYRQFRINPASPEKAFSAPERLNPNNPTQKTNATERPLSSPLEDRCEFFTQEK